MIENDVVIVQSTMQAIPSESEVPKALRKNDAASAEYHNKNFR
jgi:hypothetical protein